MAYDHPQSQSYCFGIHDFGAGGDALSIKGPSGKTGRLIDIVVSATETFNAVTTEGAVQVGTAADPDAFASLGLGTLADTDSKSASETAGAIIAEALPADTPIEVTFVAPVGGTPAGQGYVHIHTEWY